MITSIGLQKLCDLVIFLLLYQSLGDAYMCIEILLCHKNIQVIVYSTLEVETSSTNLYELYLCRSANASRITTARMDNSKVVIDKMNGCRRCLNGSMMSPLSCQLVAGHVGVRDSSSVMWKDLAGKYTQHIWSRKE